MVEDLALGFWTSDERLLLRERGVADYVVDEFLLENHILKLVDVSVDALRYRYSICTSKLRCICGLRL